MIEQDIHTYPIRKVEDIASSYRDYKINESVYDYTDMLVMAKTADITTPELEYMFVDEAQDLSTLQWILIDRMAATTKHIVIAGDDKQAINEFAGADVDTFLQVPGKVEVLEQSYRVPRLIFDVANNVVKHMKKYRVEGSNWNPKKEEGVVKRVQSFPVQALYSGDWLVLGRTSWQLEAVKDLLLKHSDGLIFNVNGAAPIPVDAYRAIQLLEVACGERGPGMGHLLHFKEDDTPDIRKRKMEYIQLFKKFASFYTVSKTPQPWEVNDNFIEKLEQGWEAAFDKLTLAMRRYLKVTYPFYLKQGDELFMNAPIRLMTIHAAKGREADNVVVLLDVPRTVKNTIILQDTDSEAKILYVAVTRAKKKLYLYGKDTDKYSLAKYLK